jgi:NAD(P)-dependent dehydrogenase (short-subunit alcohol dehydrogenase family)
MGVYAMTGGATGIGAAIRARLAGAGHRVVVVDLRDADVIADLGSPEGRALAIAGIRAAAPEGLDGFIPCAGVASHVPDRALIASVNYFGTVELLEALGDLLVARRGTVVLVSSNSAPMNVSEALVEACLANEETRAREIAAGTAHGQLVYGGSKRALARWMRRNSPAWAQLGVRMNAIAPGYTQTPMTEAVEKDPTFGPAIREFLASIPVGRPGQPEDMADAVEFLLSPKASFVCGAVLFIDGGHDAMMRPDAF